MLLSVAVKDVESIVQDAETKGKPVNLTALSYWRFFNRDTHLKKTWIDLSGTNSVLFVWFNTLNSVLLYIIVLYTGATDNWWLTHWQ